MSVNAREEQFEHAELFGKPVLFTDSRIDRTTVPKEFYCYDLRGSDRDTGKPTTVENQVAVNYAGTVLTSEPIAIPKEGFCKICGKLNFLGECLTLPEFCVEHGIELQPDNYKFILRPASSDEAGLFFTPPRERDIEMGAIGHVRIDFGSEGNEFWHTWWPRGDEALNSPEFKTELQELINELRENGPLKNLSTMYSYCGDHGGQIAGGWRQNYGYVVDTDHYRYCLRCNPGPGDYHAYLSAFDLRKQELHMKHEATTQEYGMTEAGKKMLRDAADPALPHRYSWFVFQDFNMPAEKLIRNLTLPEAIQLYNETGSGNKRLGITKDDTATVDLVIASDGEQKFSKDYTQLDSFSSDPVIADAVETLQNEIMEQKSEQSMKMGGI